MVLATVSSHHWKMIQNYGVTISKPQADSCIKVCIPYLSSWRLQDFSRAGQVPEISHSCWGTGLWCHMDSHFQDYTFTWRSHVNLSSVVSKSWALADWEVCFTLSWEAVKCPIPGFTENFRNLKPLNASLQHLYLSAFSVFSPVPLAICSPEETSCFVKAVRKLIG